MTIQACKSKDRVVRLEPNFGDAPKEAENGAQAARLVRAAAAVSNRTDIRLETPDSSIVTP